MGKARILILEDDEVLCDFLRDRLTGAGYEVDARTAGARGSSGSRYDIVLSDIPKPFCLDRLVARLPGQSLKSA